MGDPRQEPGELGAWFGGLLPGRSFNRLALAFALGFSRDCINVKPILYRPM